MVKCHHSTDMFGRCVCVHCVLLHDAYQALTLNVYCTVIHLALSLRVLLHDTQALTLHVYCTVIHTALYAACMCAYVRIHIVRTNHIVCLCLYI